MQDNGGLGKGRGRKASPGTWIGGGLTAGAALVVRLWAGSPLPILHTVGAAVRLPPMWLAGLLWFAAFFLLGCAAGTVMTGHGGGPVQSAWRLRGGLYCLIAVLSVLIWYPLLFSSALLWVSLLPLLLSLASAVLCGLCWMRLRYASVLPVLAFCIFVLYLFLLQLVVLFSR